jgi:CheY-like chemotaxis protein
VLVVDDRDEVRRFIERALARCGFDVRAAGVGAEALEVFAKGWRPDLLLCDVRMPGMSGPALVQALRGRGDATPVLYMSGQHDGTTDLSGQDRLLPKPFTPDVLVAAVKAAMPARPATAGAGG